MQSVIRLKPYRLRTYVVFLVVGTLLLSVGDAPGYSRQMLRGMLLGPWEVTVQIAGAAPMRFAVEVPDVDKAADLDKVLPLPDSAVNIRLTKYLPDLKRSVSGVEDSSGNAIALIHAWGPGLDQDMWLDASDAKKRGITSSAGGMKLVEMHDPKKLEEMLNQLTQKKSVGILSVWPDKAKKPLQFVIKKGQSLSIPESDCSLKILDYMPHYSIDAKSKKVKNSSKQPLNPAIEVRCTKGDSTTEQWLWSKFPSSPHSKAKLPFRAEFIDVDFGKKPGRYILAGAAEGEPWILFFNNGKVVARKAETGKDYPLRGKPIRYIKPFESVDEDEWKAVFNE